MNTYYAYTGTIGCQFIYGLLEAASHDDARRHLGVKCRIKRVVLDYAEMVKKHNDRSFVESLFK
jgi:hypothetical protein